LNREQDIESSPGTYFGDKMTYKEQARLAASALFEIRAVLRNDGKCPINKCSGCNYEMREAWDRADITLKKLGKIKGDGK
jgi:hypothetical protein